MPKPNRFRAITADVAAVVTGAPSVVVAARRLGVHKSSVHRWITSGLVPAPGGRRERRSPPPRAPRANQSAEAWARSVRRAYELTSTEQQLLTLAVKALKLARDPNTPGPMALSAMGRFSQLIGQLDLEEERNGVVEETETIPGPAIRRIK